MAVSLISIGARRALQGCAGLKRKISVALINNLPGKNCLA
jgi:hypothetical protein